jgi:hypothetical protein
MAQKVGLQHRDNVAFNRRNPVTRGYDKYLISHDESSDGKISNVVVGDKKYSYFPGIATPRERSVGAREKEEVALAFINQSAADDKKIYALLGKKAPKHEISKTKLQTESIRKSLNDDWAKN